ncbi:MAG: four helix bundle protein, partial [Sediminibacterium sp.]
YIRYLYSFLFSSKNDLYAMSKENIILDKSFLLAKSVILFHVSFSKKHPLLYDISRQLLQSGTSVGANIEEATGAYSRKEFSSKLSISFKEIRETIYWIKLIKGTTLEKDDNLDVLMDIALEVKKILSSILLTIKQNNS